MRADSNDQAGFTLVELMVSILLLGMLTMALYAGMSFGARAWRRAAESSARLAQIASAQITLVDMLSHAHPVMLRPAGQDAHVDFDGDSDQVTFLTPAPAEIAPGGFARTTFRLEDDDSGFALVSYAQPELAETGAYVRSVLLHHVQSLVLSYFTAGRPGKPGEWLSSWHNRLRLPMLIKVQASLEGRDAPRWADLIIRPRIAADATCTFDPLTRYCRGL